MLTEVSRPRVYSKFLLTPASSSIIRNSKLGGAPFAAVNCRRLNAPYNRSTVDLEYRHSIANLGLHTDQEPTRTSCERRIHGQGSKQHPVTRGERQVRRADWRSRVEAWGRLDGFPCFYEKSPLTQERENCIVFIIESIHNPFLVIGRLMSGPRAGAFPHRGVRLKAIVQAV
jgi:hypothetical protein